MHRLWRGRPRRTRDELTVFGHQPRQRVIFDGLERDGVLVPARARDLFGDVQSALSSAFILVAGMEAEE